MARFHHLLQPQPSSNDFCFVALSTKGLFKLAGVSYEVSALRAEVDESKYIYCVVSRDIFISLHFYRGRC